MAGTCVRFAGEVWLVEEVKDLVREGIAALTNSRQDHDLLIRIDEMLRSTALQVQALRQDFGDIDKRYLTKADFEPYRRALWGLGAIVGSTVAYAVLRTILPQVH